MTIQEIRREIRRLRKIKKDLRASTPERLNIGRKIKELKNQITLIPDKEKERIIREILKRDMLMAKIDIDLYKHNIEDLKKYLEKLKVRKK